MWRRALAGDEGVAAQGARCTCRRRSSCRQRHDVLQGGNNCDSARPACSTPAVAIILEMARTIIANPAIKLSAPVVFLLNGGEETLSQAANGFFASSRWG